MCGNTSDSAVYELYQYAPETFPAAFHDIVLPAISEGFSAERYRPSDIERFAQGIDKALEKLDPSLPQTFRNFAIPLVAALIYGPGHTAAQSGTNSPTFRGTQTNGIDDLPSAIVDDKIILTQIFSSDAGLVGHSSHFETDCAILLGRDSDMANYLDECDPEFAEAIKEYELLLFPISHTHKSTSKAHGIIAYIGDNWYFYDFSTNGTYIENSHQPSAVHCGIVTLAPGDRIHLGLSEPPADNLETHHLATTILVSFKLDETNIF